MVNQAFPNFGQEFGVNFFGNSSYPRVNVADTSKEVRIEAEIAGLGKKMFLLNMKTGCLQLQVTRKTKLRILM